MTPNGHAGEIVDLVARERADKALEAGRSAWEAVGDITREVSRQTAALVALEGRLARHFGWSAPPAPDGEEEGPVEEHPWGRRAYDPEEEITSSGTRAKIPVERLRRMEDDLRRIKTREADAAKKEREAKLKEQGADELIKTWKKRARLIVAIGTPTAGAIGWALHWFLGR
jgi:hypothetical protein